MTSSSTPSTSSGRSSIEILVASFTELAVSFAVASPNSPISEMLIPLRYNSRRLRLIVKLPIFSCENAMINNMHTTSIMPSKTRWSLSIRSNAAPRRFGCLCGTYILTIVSGSTSSPYFSIISSSSSIRMI